MSFYFLRCHPPLNLNTDDFPSQILDGKSEGASFPALWRGWGFPGTLVVTPGLSSLIPPHKNNKSNSSTTSHLTFLVYRAGGKGFCTCIHLILSKTCCRLKSHLTDPLPSTFRISGRSYFKNWWKIYQDALLESCMCFSTSTCMYTGQRFHNCREFSVCAVPDGDSSVGRTGSWPALRSKPLIQ